MTLAAGVAAAALATDAGAALVGHWEFDNTFNATVGTNATAVNGASFGTDRNGNPNSALSVVGTSGQYASVADGGGLNNLQTGTIAFWIAWSGTQDLGFGGVAGAATSRQDNGFSSEQIIALSGANPATATITWAPYSFTPTLTGGTAVGDGAWHHVAITYTSGDHRLYIDGNLDGTAATAGAISNKPAVALGIGAWYGDGASFATSLIDDFQVHNVVLSENEIKILAGIPEPSSAALALLGLLGFVGFRRRR